MQAGSGASAAPDDRRFLSIGDEAGTAPGDRAFRPDVQGLRGIAVLLVVLFHCGIPQFKGGFFGVDVFFVISGFVITGVLLRERAASGQSDLLRFYARRARRILPAALLVIVVTLIATDLALGSHDATIVGSDSRWTTVFLGNFHFSIVDPTFLANPFASPLEHYWSLAVEEQFYLFYPLLFIVLLAVPGRWGTRARLTVGLVCLVAASLTYSLVTSEAGRLASYYSPFTRGWELAAGALVAVCTPALERVPWRWAALATWAGFVAILVPSMTTFVGTALPGTATIYPVAGAALVIAGGVAARPRWGVEAFLGLAPVRRLGDWSYSWYLWHWPILVIAATYARKTVFGSSIAKNMLLSAAALVLAALTYAFVEKPVRHTKLFEESPGLLLLGAGLLVASCFALTYAF